MCATEKKEICLSVREHSGGFADESSQREDEPVRQKGVAERGTEAGKGALTLPTLRPGVRLPPTSSSSGASASLPSSTSSVRPCVLASTVRRSRHRFLTSPALFSFFFLFAQSADLCENLMKLKLQELA